MARDVWSPDRNGFRFLDPWDRVRVLRPTGHMMLVRRTKRPVSEFLVGEATAAAREAGAFKALEASLSENAWTHTCMVLAVGPLCGRRRSRRALLAARLFREDPMTGRRRWLDGVFDGEPGDYVLVGEKIGTGRIVRCATGYEYDYLVDEGNIENVVIPRAFAEARGAGFEHE